MIYPGGGNSRQVGVLGCNMQVQVSWQTVESLQLTKSEALSATPSSWKVWFNNMKAASWPLVVVDAPQPPPLSLQGMNDEVFPS